jgi:hypothetical protein
MGSNTRGEPLVEGAVSRIKRQCSKRRDCMSLTSGGKNSSSDCGKQRKVVGKALTGGWTWGGAQYNAGVLDQFLALAP